MKKILNYLNTYRTEELKPAYALSILLFMGLYVGFEYGTHWSLPYKTTYYGTYQSVLFTFSSFLIPFAGGYFLYSIFYKDWGIWKNKLFIFLLFLAPAAFSLRTLSNLFSGSLLEMIPEGRTANFYHRCLLLFIRDIIIIIPVVFYWLKMDKKIMPLYGLTLKNYSIKPYLILLGLMVPLVVLASYQGDFLSQYPKGFSLYPLDFNNLADRKYFYIFELFYGFDFFFIEFFFRGFLLLAFFRHFGWGVLLPAACFYVSIHFGKPMGETISSFFGGTILGIIAIRTGSVAGGIIVHLGVAWLMEFTALLHKIL